MSQRAFLVRVQDRTGALERLLGLVRRKALPIRSGSISWGGRNALEVFLRGELGDESPPRVEAELGSVLNVMDVQDLGAAEGLFTREMALVRVPPGTGPFVPFAGRLIHQDQDGDLLELTGTPEEVEAALAELARKKLLAAYRRSGAMPAPGGSTNRKGEQGG